MPSISSLGTLSFSSRVTFFVGENGTGKSTLLEALALAIGFGPQGGSLHSVNALRDRGDQGPKALADALQLTWSHRRVNGYFFRAESFFDVATHVDELDAIQRGMGFKPYGGQSLHSRSHGESFMALLLHRLGSPGMYLFDEPEAALSPQRQLSFLVWLNDHLQGNRSSQFIIATHSPIILAFPGAQLLSFDGGTVSPISYSETEHYRITRRFMSDPSREVERLLRTSSSEE